jgi:DNA modification methylase
MKLLLGDCLDKLKELEDNSVDSIVTDPPYELGFMGKGWDSSGIAFNKEVWNECLRVLKPGGHLLAFGGTRTYHRMTVAIEDSGFEIRDCIFWCYGQGFPKSMDISKQIDKKLGAQREVIGKTAGSGMTKSNVEQGAQNRNVTEWDVYSNNPVTDEAKQWSGYGTALKPAHEPIVMARKPLSEKTVVDNVLKWGTGGINIDESRISTDEELGRDFTNGKSDIFGGGSGIPGSVTSGNSNGRFPANIIFDEEAGKMLDEQTGVLTSGFMKAGTIRKMSESDVNTYGHYDSDTSYRDTYGDSGGASRFFYCPKVSKSERNEGLDISNPHPTLKPVSLMRYLIRLVTPKGGTTLDPFMGSGSTGKAAVRGGFDFIGIEREDEYFKIAEARIEYEKNKPKGNVKNKTPKKETEETLNKFFG